MRGKRHRREAEIAVPNRTGAAVVSEIHIAPAKAGLEGLNFGEAGELHVVGYGLSTNRCEKVPAGKLPHDLTLKLAPWDLAFVRVVIETVDPPHGAPAIAPFSVTDTRGGKLTGGVTVVASTIAPIDTGNPAPRNPCPLQLAGDAYSVELGDSPDQKGPPVIPNDRPRQFVAPITNPTNAPLKKAVAYLEHLDSSGVVFEPVTWTIGNMDPGDTFWATWTVDARGALASAYEASIVVRDDDHEPIRIRAAFRVTSRREQR